MADDYWRYAAQRDSFQPAGSKFDMAGMSTSLRGHLLSDTSSLAGQQLWRTGDPLLSSSDFRHTDIPSLKSSSHHFDDVMGIGKLPRPEVAGGNAGTSLAGFSSSYDDPLMLSRRRDPLGINSVIPPVLPERTDSALVKSDVLSEGTDILFVEGLPTDCTRREVAHLFRPFIGFKEIRVIHKEPRRAEDKAFVICFVEFKDAKCAATALEALQDSGSSCIGFGWAPTGAGYRFDDKKPDAQILRIQFARFPFRPYDSHDKLQNNAR